MTDQPGQALPLGASDGTSKSEADAVGASGRVLTGCVIPNHGCDHDCAADRCNEPFHDEVIFSEGYGGLGAGLTYDDNPYGHHHPDGRFNAWVRGWYSARHIVGLCRYCDNKRLHTMVVCQEHRGSGDV